MPSTHATGPHSGVLSASSSESSGNTPDVMAGNATSGRLSASNANTVASTTNGVAGGQTVSHLKAYTSPASTHTNTSSSTSSACAPRKKSGPRKKDPGGVKKAALHVTAPSKLHHMHKMTGTTTSGAVDTSSSSSPAPGADEPGTVVGRVAVGPVTGSLADVQPDTVGHVTSGGAIMYTCALCNTPPMKSRFNVERHIW